MKLTLVRRLSLTSAVILGCAGSGSGSLGGSSPPGEQDAGGASDDDAGRGSSLPPPGGGSSEDGGGSGTDDGGGPGQQGDSDGAVGDTDGGESYGPYGGDGTNTFTTTTLQVPAPNGTFTVTVYIPGATTPMPVVMLSSGLQQTAAAYAPYASRLATWGIITFLRDDPGVLGKEASPALAEDVGYMASTWLTTLDTDSSGPLDGKIDSSRIGLAGHSRGGQVAILAAAGPAHGLVKGVFGLDPVDSAGDAGMGLATAQISGVGVPLAFMGETTDSAATSCAPAADNYQVLYQAAASPIVGITAIHADHTMFEQKSSCTFCFICTAGTANASQVLAYSQRYLMAFFARELLGDTTVGATFAGAGVNADVAAGLVQLESK